ncbi:MAG: energy transducer TonB [Alistipes sp.]|jgi:TonB family protein|nr:energy transducer TonB [Alistipes sp.]
MQNRRQRLDLPFIKRRRDSVTWIYDHRVGVFSLVALALAMAILFIGSKVVVRAPAPDNAIVVDLRTVEELQAEAERLRREVRVRQSEMDVSDVRNAISNEGAELRDDRGTNNSSMRDRLDGVNDRMRGNRDAWDQGLRDIEAIRGERDASGERNVNNDTRARGTVQVTFSLLNPTRYSVDLVNPGYRCERGGEVTVQVTVTRSGDVASAAVDRDSSTPDDCMHQTALDAARRSRFDVNPSAPERHTGTITYIFIPQ